MTSVTASPLAVRGKNASLGEDAAASASSSAFVHHPSHPPQVNELTPLIPSTSQTSSDDQSSLLATSPSHLLVSPAYAAASPSSSPFSPFHGKKDTGGNRPGFTAAPPERFTSPRTGNLSELIRHASPRAPAPSPRRREGGDRRGSLDTSGRPFDNEDKEARYHGDGADESFGEEEDEDDDEDAKNGDGGGESRYAYFASPSKILCSACMKGDYFQAQNAVDIAVKNAESVALADIARAAKLPSQQQERHDDYEAAHVKQTISTAIFRLLMAQEPRHQMNPLHLAVLYDHPTLVEYLVVVAKKYLSVSSSTSSPKQSSKLTVRHSSSSSSSLTDREMDVIASSGCGTFQEFVDAPCGDAKHRATALMLATSVACATILIDHGANLEARNSSGMAALHYAASTGNAGFVSLLIHRGADVNQRDARGATALHWAVFEGFQYTAMLLVGYNADQSVLDSEDQTPLMIASALGDAFLAKQLVIEGAPVNAKDKHGRTALDIARQGAHFDTVGALKAGASDRFVAWASRRGATVIFFWVMVLGGETLSLLFAVPTLGSQNAATYALFSVALCAITCGLYTYVWLKDPGYVDKSSQPAYELLASECNSVPCPTCVTLKPLRSKHCSSCRRCVYRFDHHCPWINNCVGIGNHSGFLVFLSFLSVFCAFIGTLSASILIGTLPLRSSSSITQIDSWWSTLQQPQWAQRESDTSTLLLRLVHVFLLFSATLFGLPTFVLLCLQVRNVAKNLTTNEVFNKDKYPYLKTPMDEFHNPYDHGCWRNCGEVCMGRNVEFFPPEQNKSYE
uniref:Palmitoyltransferase n=1 Tax=Globisporangium ultimum (strain ATCC 200006 / CBS 805.95 / DAOM BR144) TaxID=431595 RepID=K3X3E9_GLOUD